MTFINGRSIQYQGSSLYPIRMITEDGRIEFVWDGNNLIEYKKYIGSTLSVYYKYKYNSKGLRIEKLNAKNNFKTIYVYDENDRLILEKRSDNKVFRYYYDTNNELCSFTLNNTMFFYDRDAFKNIKNIIDVNGNIVVSYKCDAFGQNEVISGSLASTLGIFNPFRYKGYYYDEETQLFY